MSPIESLPNLGPATSGWLRAAGISTVEDLRKVGVMEAYQRCALDGRPVSLVLLYALEAGLRGKNWMDLSKKDREKLRRERDKMEMENPVAKGKRKP